MRFQQLINTFYLHTIYTHVTSSVSIYITIAALSHFSGMLLAFIQLKQLAKLKKDPKAGKIGYYVFYYYFHRFWRYGHCAQITSKYEQFDIFKSLL
jgi:hypothetical protein